MHYCFISLIPNELLVFKTGEGIERKHTGKCYDCDGPLVLMESDFKRSTRIMQCQRCGLFHIHKKDFLGNWKLMRVTKTLPNSSEG